VEYMGSMAAMILAAGGSTRMGRAKQLLRIGGETLVHRTARAVVEAGCGPIFVVMGAGADAIASEVSDLPVKRALNADWEKGMGGSIRAGLRAILANDPKAEAAAILLCDQPGVELGVLRELFAAFSNGLKPIAACRYRGTLGPPCCFERSMFDELLQLRDGEGAKRILMKDAARLTVMDWAGGESDLDTPGDWARFCKTGGASGESPR
jgi:molybdenum cofactor cytidylyltransferase